jgi:putative flippase GtrA
MKELYNKYKEIVNYVIVGGLTTVVSLAVYYALVLTVLDPDNPVQLQIANVISWIAAVTFAYFTNRRFVFESKTKGEEQTKEVISFYSARLGTLLMDMGIMFVGKTVLHINDKIVKLFVQVVVMVANYVISKLLVFKKSKSEEKKTEDSE